MALTKVAPLTKLQGHDLETVTPIAIRFTV